MRAATYICMDRWMVSTGCMHDAEWTLASAMTHVAGAISRADRAGELLCVLRCAIGVSRAGFANVLYTIRRLILSTRRNGPVAGAAERGGTHMRVAFPWRSERCLWRVSLLQKAFPSPPALWLRWGPVWAIDLRRFLRASARFRVYLTRVIRGGIETLCEPITLAIVRRVPYDISGESRGSYRLLWSPERVGRAPATPAVASFDL